MLYIFDMWFLNRVEKFSHWWQRMFGQDCFWLARQMVVISIITNFICGLMFMGIALEDILTSILCGLVSLIWLPYIALTESGVRKAQKDFLSNPEKLASKERLNFVLMLSSTVVLLVGGISIFLAGFILHVPIVYFCACDPLSPSKSKARKRLESAIGAIKDALSPSSRPEPVPIPSR